MEAGYGSRARHWNGIKTGVTDGWTARDYNFQLIASSDSSSLERMARILLSIRMIRECCHLG
jgi:hypothetical protein